MADESYSFCETATASGTTPWHIRKLTAVGRKPGGGADTPSLCGRDVAWDVERDCDLSITLPLEHCCQRCRAEMYRDALIKAGLTV